MQIDNKFIAFFLDSTTAPGLPITGLSATITIIDTSGNVAINNQAMTEIGNGYYLYTFTGMVNNIEYAYSCNPNSSLAFIESGVTQNTLYTAISDIMGGRGGSGSINISGIQTTIRNSGEKVIKELSDKMKESEQYICKDIEDKKLDIQPIIDKIDSIEIPEIKIEEKEAKNANKLLTALDKKLSSYIESEMKEKYEGTQIINELYKLELEEKEQEMKDKEEEKKKEEEEKRKKKEEEAKELEMIIKEIENINTEEKDQKKKELEKEIKEKQKELNSLS